MDITQGDFLIRRRDNMLALVVEHGGGSHDWYDLRLASGRTVTVSASGIKAKYSPLPKDISVEVEKIVRKSGLTSSTLDEAKRAVEGSR